VAGADGAGGGAGVIADANLTIEQLEAEAREAMDRRYAFYRMLHATDRILWRLEELNRDGVVVLPSALGAAIRPALAELPESCLEPLAGGTVQAALDSVFDVQEALFRLYQRGRVIYKDCEDDSPAPAELDERILSAVARKPGSTHTELVRRYPDSVRRDVQRRLPELVAAGALRAITSPPKRPGPVSTRYWVVEGGMSTR